MVMFGSPWKKTNVIVDWKDYIKLNFCSNLELTSNFF